MTKNSLFWKQNREKNNKERENGGGKEGETLGGRSPACPGGRRRRRNRRWSRRWNPISGRWPPRGRHSIPASAPPPPPRSAGGCASSPPPSRRRSSARAIPAGNAPSRWERRQRRAASSRSPTPSPLFPSVDCGVNERGSGDAMGGFVFLG